MRALLGHLIESGRLGRASLKGKVFQIQGEAKPKAVRWGEQQSIPRSEEAGSPGRLTVARPHGAAWGRQAMVRHLGGHMWV